MTHQGASEQSGGLPTPDIRIVRGNPTPAEVGAVLAVVTAALEQAADDTQTPPERSAWSWSQRTLRSTVTPRAGAWRGFTG